MKLITWIYALALHLYPPDFRREYAREMQAVFLELLENAHNRGQFGSARIIVREFGDLPGNLLRLFWNDFNDWIQLPWQDQAALNANISHPGSWYSASMAGLPHFLYALAFYLPLLLATSLALPDYLGPNLSMFWGMVVFMLLVARRLGWPDWSASWVGYGLVFLLTQISNIFHNVTLSILACVIWLVLAFVLLFWQARRAWISGLLAVLPISPMWIWLAQRETISGSLEEAALFVSASMMLALAVMAIVRLGRWQTALLLILAVILATGLPGSFSTANFTLSNQLDENLWNGTSNWILNYSLVLVLTAPLWVMVLAKHVFSSRQTRSDQLEVMFDEKG